MTALTRNIDARDRLTAIILGQSVYEVAPRQLNASQASDALFGHHYKQPGMATADDCMYWSRRVAKALGQEAYEALLGRNGITQRPLTIDMLKTGLWAGWWQPFVDYAKTAVYFGLDPQWAWDVRVDESGTYRSVRPYLPEQITRKPVEELRTRWLLYHDGSDSLFIAESWRTAKDCLERSGEDIADVTGIEFYEQLFEANQSKETRP